MNATHTLKLATWQSRAVATPSAIARFFPFIQPAAVTIECLGGCLWITLDGDPQDHILRAGQSAEFRGKGLMVTSFAETSIIRLTTRRRQQRADVLEQLLAPA